MKKKTYQQPEMKVVKLEQTEIICTSTLESAFSLDDGGVIGNGDEDSGSWGTDLTW